MRLASLASLAAALHLAVASPLPLTRRTDPPVVDLGYAQYQGVLNETYNMYEWRGIRYATAERFQAPRTPSKNSSDSSPILADHFGNVCYISQVGANTTQGVLTEEATTPSAMQSEDCLFLNVVSPAGSCEGADLPVVVYIHGGGASSVPCTRKSISRAGPDSALALRGGYGFGDSQIQFEEFLQHIGNKVVLVSIQYRLGPFGFLAGSEIVANGAVNNGLLDQVRRLSSLLLLFFVLLVLLPHLEPPPTLARADSRPPGGLQQFALQWVQTHIGKFGGNSDHVTIFGESAGAGSVLNQVIANVRPSLGLLHLSSIRAGR